MNDILRISVPLTVWIAAFSAVYGLQGIVCSDHWGAAGLGLSAARAALVAAWLVAIAIQLGLLLVLQTPRYASPSRWVRWVSVALGIVALISTVWTLLPVVMTSVCI
ncbi:hypothetical protein KTN05_06030 [Paracoccus sp. Z118]|uniref:hypothetical protein n=1 Tax=Paracoccus sp. Z118 TaxID=2851017 RepID=UPI001C2C4F1E|nr:hypothetical protein [Paracoccus sp. Z118]MBV0891412.1 hypothetical protein [Paracoccus sp. Z118]